MSKRRDANFTKEETDKLMELVEQYLDIILNNKCTSDVNRQKEDAWNLIAEEFNSFTTQHRTAKQLRHKLENMKKRSALKKLQEEMQTNKMSMDSLEGDNEEDAHAKWEKRLREGDTWGDGDTNTDAPEPSPKKKPKIQTVYVKPPPTLGDTEATENKTEASGEQHRETDTSIYSPAQVQELFKLECKQRQERHRQQMEHQKKFQEAQLNKLALEARIYEAQLNKTNLEVKQLTRRLQREEELHSARLRREEELHARQMAGTQGTEPAKEDE